MITEKEREEEEEGFLLFHTVFLKYAFMLWYYKNIYELRFFSRLFIYLNVCFSLSFFKKRRYFYTLF